MARTSPGTIIIQAQEKHVHLEYVAASGSSIRPGDLLEIASGEVQEHSDAAGVVAPFLVAIEDPWADSDTEANIDHAYAVGETVYCIMPQRGDVLYMWVATGNTADADIDLLESAGAGNLAVAATQAAADATEIAGAQIGVPVETVANSSGSDARIKVRIL